MTTDEIIQLLKDDIQESKEIIAGILESEKYDLIGLNYNCIIKDYFEMGLTSWRAGQNPIQWLMAMIQSVSEAESIFESLTSEEMASDKIDVFYSIYAAYLVGVDHAPISLDDVNENVRAAAFFGNVLIDAANIDDWSKYRDALPPGKRYDLARETNELYADLLAGRISPEMGVRLGEKLWAERVDNVYFGNTCGGNGDENDQIVDYQLGAILNKIGSTVPTVHAWVW